MKKRSNAEKTKMADLQQKVRDLLTSEFNKKKALNPRYSKRSFAKYLEIDSSYLVKIFADKRKLSYSTLLGILDRLALPEHLRQELVEYNVPHFTPIKTDEFRLIADSYHYAILELVKLTKINVTLPYIVEKLEISQREAEAAIERLIRLGLLAQKENGQFVCLKNNTTISNKYTDEAFRLMQRQILKKAVTALDTVPLADRDQSSITLCVDKKRIPEAKRRIKKFRRSLMKYLENGKVRDDVYYISISLFPATKR
jgi:hypothetical protein